MIDLTVKPPEGKNQASREEMEATARRLVGEFTKLSWVNCVCLTADDQIIAVMMDESRHSIGEWR